MIIIPRIWKAEITITKESSEVFLTVTIELTLEFHTFSYRKAGSLGIFRNDRLDYDTERPV